MTDLVRCDYCKTERKTDGKCWDDWRHVTHGGLVAYGDNPGPWDFCSASCLVSYFMDAAMQVHAIVIGMLVHRLGGEVVFEDKDLEVFEGKIKAEWDTIETARDPIIDGSKDNTFMLHYKPGPRLVIRTLTKP